MFYKEINEQRKQVEKDLQKLSIGTPEYYTLMAKLEQLQGELKAIEKRIGQRTDNGSNYTRNIGDNL